MVSYPTDVERYRWVGTQKGMRCAGIRGIEVITETKVEHIDREAPRVTSRSVGTGETTEHEYDKLTNPTPYQRRVLELLDITL